MTKNDTKMFLELVKRAYPRSKMQIDPMTMGFWFSCFKKVGFEHMKAALRQHVMESKWCPEPAEINKQLREIVPPEQKVDPVRTFDQVAKENESKARYRCQMAAIGCFMLKEGKSYRYVKYKGDNALWTKAGEELVNGEMIPFLLPTDCNH